MASPTARTKPKRSKTAKRTSRKLSNAQLLKLAAKHRPPQKWFDQTDVPFIPVKD